jgi:hypothetical protein
MAWPFFRPKKHSFFFGVKANFIRRFKLLFYQLSKLDWMLLVCMHVGTFKISWSTVRFIWSTFYRFKFWSTFLSQFIRLLFETHFIRLLFEIHFIRLLFEINFIPHFIWNTLYYTFWKIFHSTYIWNTFYSTFIWNTFYSTFIWNTFYSNFIRVISKLWARSQSYYRELQCHE